MHALVYFIVRFIFVTLRLGSVVRGPDDHRDIHLDPVSHPNAKEAGLMEVDSSGRWSTVPAARKLVVSHFPLEERSSDMLRKCKAFTGYQRTEEAGQQSNERILLYNLCARRSSLLPLGPHGLTLVAPKSNTADVQLNWGQYPRMSAHRAGLLVKAPRITTYI